MAQMLFNPYQDLIFDEHFCFLTGVLSTEKMTVFPVWLMDHFKFGEEKIEMMDKTKSYIYTDLKLPCSPEVKQAFNDLDIKIQAAYKQGFGVNGFGFIACLQDNGIIAESQNEILEKMKGHVLHPVQFEELYARFHYSDYILQYSAQHNIESNEKGITVESLPIEGSDEKPVFGFWDEGIFAQLLSNYWQVYGIEREDIIKFQKPPLSFLENPYSKDFINPEDIELPF